MHVFILVHVQNVIHSQGYELAVCVDTAITSQVLYNVKT